MLLREVRHRMQAKHRLIIQDSLLPGNYGHGTHHKCEKTPEERLKNEYDDFKLLQSTPYPQEIVLSREEVEQVIKAEFRGELGKKDLLDRSITGLNFLNHLLDKSDCSSINTCSQGVTVEVLTAPRLTRQAPSLDALLGANSEPKHVFYYRVRISYDETKDLGRKYLEVMEDGEAKKKQAQGPSKVRVLGRHLRFVSADGSVMEVPKGSHGVVGFTPILKHNEMFEYMSAGHIEDRRGFLQGSFQMVRMGHVPEDRFDAPIVPAAFIAPESESDLNFKPDESWE